ncbi:MAG: nodulation protein NfeD [Bryobacteraceae bacterium]
MERNDWAIFALFVMTSGMSAATPKVLTVAVDGIVHPVTVEIVERALAQAKDSKAELVILRLNTPGGLMDAMRQTVEKIVASEIPVAAYVGPSGGRAASAGFFLLEAADVAAMAPGTNTGAAHPVLATGGQMDAVMKQKVENDAAASIRSLTAKRGRNSALAEKVVLESKSFTEKEALENHLIETIARDERDLVAQLDGREITRFDGRRQTLKLKDAEIAAYAPSLRQRILSAISDPNAALILIVLGVLSIYVEFSAPGLIFPGVAGSIAAVLGLSALSLLPINWTGAALILLAFTLFILEAKFTSHGILGVGGGVALVLGAMLLIDSPLPELRVRLSVALSLAVPFTAITLFLLTLAVRARANKVITGAAGMINEMAVAITELSPRGKVFVHGEYWDAVSSSPAEKAPGCASRGSKGWS